MIKPPFNTSPLPQPSENPSNTLSERSSATNQPARMSASYAFSWDAAPLGWPANLGATWRSETYKTPLPCREGAGCTYPGVCSFVHPGEEGRSLKFFAGRSRQEGSRQIWESPTVRLWISREERAPFYERRSQRKSWAAWCEQEGIPYQAGQRPEYARRADQRRERIQLSPAAEALSVSSDEDGRVEFTEEEIELAPFAEVAEASLTLRAIQEQNARQQENLYRQALERSHAAWTAQWQLQQQLWNAQLQAWQQQQAAAAERQAIGEQLFVDAQDALERSAADREVLGMAGPLFTAGKIVGMILEAHTLEDLRRIVQDPNGAEFSELLMDACEVLKAAAPPAPAQTVIQPPRPVVPGNEALSACVDDTIRELLEDIRREDAGLPPLERGPSITSYERRTDGAVLRTALLA
jgi:hypothetical protein